MLRKFLLITLILLVFGCSTGLKSIRNSKYTIEITENCYAYRPIDDVYSKEVKHYAIYNGNASNKQSGLDTLLINIHPIISEWEKVNSAEDCISKFLFKSKDGLLCRNTKVSKEKIIIVKDTINNRNFSYQKFEIAKLHKLRYSDTLQTLCDKDLTLKNVNFIKTELRKNGYNPNKNSKYLEGYPKDELTRYQTDNGLEPGLIYLQTLDHLEIKYVIHEK